MKSWKIGVIIGAIPPILFFGYWALFICERGATGEQALCVPFTIG